MTRIRITRPSPALLVSFAALFVALSGTAMALQANSIGSKELKRGAVRSSDIKDNRVGSRDLRNNSIRSRDLRNGRAVHGRDVADDSLHGADIDESTLDLRGLGVPPAGAAGGDLSGRYPDPAIARASVTTAHLADDAVRGAKVADGSLTGADIADDGIGGRDIAARAVTATALGTASVGGRALADGTVRAADLGNATLRRREFTVGVGSHGVFSQCRAGEQVLSGGALLPAGNNRGLQSSYPNPNGWTAVIRNNSGGPIEVSAYALCLR